MRPLRILWICSHRTHRIEEVEALLKTGAEVIPIATPNLEFPNAIDPEEESDPSYPAWRPRCTIPAPDLERLRSLRFYDEPLNLTEDDRGRINKWIDVVLVASFTRIVANLLDWYKGAIIFRVFGGYPYSRVMKPWTPAGHRTLNRIAHSDRYYWCPILPYLGMMEDPRLTRNEVIVPAFVSKPRLRHEWAGASSSPFVSDVISMIDRYRMREYRAYVAAFGDLGVKIFGQNDKSGELGRDDRVVGTLTDDAYYAQLASSRAMIYVGLGTTVHLHYHPLEAMAMKVPVIFLRNGAIAHHSRYYGQTEDELKAMGMCADEKEAHDLARRCLDDAGVAQQLSTAQDALRNHFSPARAQQTWATLVEHLTLKRNYIDNVPTRPEGKSPTSLRGIAERVLMASYNYLSG
jgi:hypothetical protein